VEKDNFKTVLPCVDTKTDNSLIAKPFVGLSSASTNCTSTGTCGNL